MAHYEIVPNTTRFVCSGNAAYGLVRVRDTETPGSPEVEVRVDTNWADGTERPQIIVNGTRVDIDDAFLRAYNNLQRGTGAASPEQQAACTDMEAAGRTVVPPPPPSQPAVPEAPKPWSPAWIIVPIFAEGAQYYLDRFGRNDLNRIPTDFGSMGSASNLLYIGSQSLFVGTYIPLHRRWDSTPAWIFDGACLATSLGFGIAAGVQEPGQGTPELSTALTLASTCVPAMIYGNNDTSRTPLRFWSGFATQLVEGGVFLGLGYGGVGARPEVTGADRYAPSSIPAGSRGVGSNPYEQTPFPGINTDMRILGFVQAGGALVNLADYLIFTGPPSPTRPHVSVTPNPGGANISVVGRF